MSIKGLRGIIGGGFLTIGGNVAIQPYDWHSVKFILLFTSLMLISITCVVYGALTLGNKKKPDDTKRGN